MPPSTDSQKVATADAAEPRAGPWQLVGYFLKLGTIGFGGPVALVGFMHRDLVERRHWITEDTYKLSLALAQIMPGPLAAQVAIAIGYFEGGVLGATLVGLGFILPSFLMVVAISLAYVAYGGLWWMQALFYAIGATVIAIIAIAAYKLARSTNKRDPLLWGIFVVLTAVTIWAQAELAEFFILAGLAVLIVRAWPGWKPGLLMAFAGVLLGSAIWLFEAWVRQSGTAADSQHILTEGSSRFALMYEHSYHMDYAAKAVAYVDAVMENINWENASALYGQNTHS